MPVHTPYFHPEPTFGVKVAVPGLLENIVGAGEAPVYAGMPFPVASTASMVTLQDVPGVCGEAMILKTKPPSGFVLFASRMKPALVDVPPA